MGEEDYHLDKIYRALANLAPLGDMPVLPADCKCVLDVGCGAGQTLFTFGNHPDLTLVGIDNDQKAVKLGKTFWPWINLICTSGEQLPFTNDCFDFVFARVSLPYMRLRVALTELNRVLRPGAGLWITLHPAEKAIRRILTGARTLDFKDALYQSYVLINGLSLHLLGMEFDFPLKRSRHESIQTNRGIRWALQDCGFDQVDIQSEKSFVVTAKKRKDHDRD